MLAALTTVIGVLSTAGGIAGLTWGASTGFFSAGTWAMAVVVAGGEEAGIFAAGCARMPLDVTRSAQSGTAAALKAVQTVKGR